MNIRCWLLFISLVAASRPSCSSSAPSQYVKPHIKSWFRMKYLEGSYETYYQYTLHRFQLDDNDRDMCPDVYKTATIYAITGRYLHEMKRTCSSLYVRKSDDNTSPSHAHYMPPPAEDLRMIDLTIMDVLRFLGQLVYYTFEIGMRVMSILLAICSTLFIIMLLCCQYY